MLMIDFPRSSCHGEAHEFRCMNELFVVNIAQWAALSACCNASCPGSGVHT